MSNTSVLRPAELNRQPVKLSLLAGFLLSLPSVHGVAEELIFTDFRGGEEYHKFVQWLKPDLETVFKQHQIELKWVTVPAARAHDLVQTGKADGIALRIKEDGHPPPNLVPIDTPLTEGKFWVHMNANDSCDRNLEQLTLVQVRGIFYFKNLTYPIEQRQSVSNFSIIPKMLASQRGDYTVVPEGFYDQVDEDIAVKRCENIPPLHIQFFTYLNRKHTALAKSINATYQQYFPKPLARASK